MQLDDRESPASRSWLLGLCVDLGACAGLALLVLGDDQLKLPVLGALHWTSYGRFFLPLAACLVCGVHPRRSALCRLGGWLRPRIEALPSRWQTLLICSSLLVVCTAHGIVVFRRHFAFLTAMDLAIYGNACRGALYSTMKGDVWIFADHFEPLLLLFTPLCRLTSPAAVLLVVQLLAFACGAYGVFALARKQGWSVAPAWLVCVLYLLFAGNVAAIYYDFHLVTLALGLIPWMWFALQARKYRLLLGLGLLSLGLKESAALSLAGFGAYLLCQREPTERRLGIIFVSAGVASFLLISNVVFPMFRHGEPTMYYQKYYGQLGATPLEILTTVVTRPAVLAETLLAPDKLKYLAALLLPFLLVHLRKPLLLLPVLPAIAINMLSNDHNLTGRACHYESEIYPALFAMSVIAFTQARRARALWLAVMLVVGVGPSPISVARGIVITEHHRRLNRQLEAFAPSERSIATSQAIAAHLTDRKGLYMFDYYGMQDDWRRADVFLIGFPAPTVGIYSWYTLIKRVLPQMEQGMREIFRDPNDPRFRLYEVTASKSPLPSHPIWNPEELKLAR